ncbi:hypothetical protein MHU86_13110 [Fragilaria crotonensis]|nr:hypothetical protein MHU86_13110 [Fragilaria crotonensis]
MSELSSRRRRNASVLAFCCILLSGTVSGFSLPQVSAAHPPQREVTTKLRISPSYTPNSLDFLASSNVVSDDKQKQQQKHCRHQNGTSQSRWNKTKERVSNLFPKPKLKEEEDYERRKQEWTNQYTNVESLRQLFGDNRNKLWGDLDATTSRRLYKTLLPRALLEMHKLGVKPEDLAPLAYKARLAAKLYARERCVVPARFCAATFDGIRQWQRYGKFQPSGMTYPQVWDKYESMILDELEKDELNDLTDEDVTAKICLKILERSCHTNERIDRFLLRGPDAYDSSQPRQRLGSKTQEELARREQEKDLTTVIAQLERDVHELLKPAPIRHEREWRASRIKTLRLLVRAKQRLDFLDKHGKESGHHHDHGDAPGALDKPSQILDPSSKP